MDAVGYDDNARRVHKESTADRETAGQNAACPAGSAPEASHGRLATRSCSSAGVLYPGMRAQDRRDRAEHEVAGAPTTTTTTTTKTKSKGSRRRRTTSRRPRDPPGARRARSARRVAASLPVVLAWTVTGATFAGARTPMTRVLTTRAITTPTPSAPRRRKRPPEMGAKPTRLK